MNKTVKLKYPPELPSYSSKQVPLVLTVALRPAGAGRGICIKFGFKPNQTHGKTAYKMSSQLWRIIHTLWKTSHDHSALTNTHVQTDLERSIGTSQATFSQGCWMCFALPNPQYCESFALVLLCDWLRRMRELCHQNEQRRIMEQTEGVTKHGTTFNQRLTNRETNLK